MFLKKKIASILSNNNCPSSHPDLNAGLCYKSCKNGYAGAATVCWTHCPEGTVNLGASCIGKVEEFMKYRGIGVPASGCARDKDCNELDYHVGFCYPKCNNNETRVVDRCYKNCPIEDVDDDKKLFRNDGLYCGKIHKGNGWGYVSNEKCEKEKGKGNCFKCLSLYYPVCPKGMISGMEHGTGCNICRTQNCPEGFVDIGVSCLKPSYSTGVGKLPNGCKDDRVYEDLMCYKDCHNNTNGNTIGTGIFCRKDCNGGRFDGTGCTRGTYDRGIGVFATGGIIRMIITIIVIIIILIIIFKVIGVVINKK